MSQLGIPIEVPLYKIEGTKTLGESMMLCASEAGYDADKICQSTLGVDKAQYSRWKNNKEGVNYQKLKELMDFCGNDTPLFFMLHDRGYDVHSIRKRQTEVEKQLAAEREARLAAEAKLSTLREFVVGIKD